MIPFLRLSESLSISDAKFSSIFNPVFSFWILINCNSISRIFFFSFNIFSAESISIWFFLSVYSLVISNLLFSNSAWLINPSFRDDSNFCISVSYWIVIFLTSFEVELLMFVILLELSILDNSLIAYKFSLCNLIISFL